MIPENFEVLNRKAMRAGYVLPFELWPRSFSSSLRGSRSRSRGGYVMSVSQSGTLALNGSMSVSTSGGGSASYTQARTLIFSRAAHSKQ